MPDRNTSLDGGRDEDGADTAGKRGSITASPTPHAALPAPGTATAVASGAAGPPSEPWPARQANRSRPENGAAGEPGARKSAEPHEHHDDQPHDLQKPHTFRLIVTLAIVVVIFAVLFAVGVLPRLKHRKELNADARAAEAPPMVNVAHPLRAPAVTDLVLPGNVLAWQETGIYARTTGYVTKWYHDIGDTVQPGEPLALIEAPDVDQQLRQAQAQLLQSRASLQRSQADANLADLTLRRNEELRRINAISQQQLDQVRDADESAHSGLEQTKANIAHDEANVQQFTEQQSWERVVAPFGGKVTARTVDVGALIMPGTTASNSGGGREMFHLAETDTLRVMINVPQTFVTSITMGQAAMVYFRDDPRHGLKGTVTRFSGALDQATRTLLTEVDVPNPSGRLTPGMYMQVKFTVTRNVPPLMVPESALVFNGQGTQVAIVSQENGKAIVHFQAIGIGRDTGSQLEVHTGLNAGDLVVTNPGERLVDGGPVKIGTVTSSPIDQQSRQAQQGQMGASGNSPNNQTEPSSMPSQP